MKVRFAKELVLAPWAMVRFLLPLSWLQTSSEARPAPVLLEIYYGTRCPNCLQEMQQSLLPLLQTQFGGDRLQITFLPEPNHEEPELTAQHLCALQDVPGPSAAGNSIALQRAVEFVICDLNLLTNEQAAMRSEATVSECMKKAGLSWEGEQACMKGGRESQGAILLMEKTYRDMIAYANERLSGSAVTPYIFINRKQLHCSGPATCDAIVDDSGLKPLSKTGTLQDIVCGMMTPPLPAACSSDGPARTGIEYNKECENCEEVGGMFAFRRQWRGEVPANYGFTLIGIVLGSLSLFAAVACKCYRFFWLPSDPGSHRASLADEAFACAAPE